MRVFVYLGIHMRCAGPLTYTLLKKTTNQSENQPTALINEKRTANAQIC